MAIIDYTLFDPFHTPQWRWQEAEQLAATKAKPGRRGKRPVDPVVQAATEYQKALAAAETPGLVEAARRRWPDTALAHTFYTENRATRWMIEGFMLAGLPISGIATRVPLDAAVVQRYADVFFDVAGKLDAEVWINKHAVKAGPWYPAPLDEAALWRYAAYVGGPFVVDVLIGDYLGRREPDVPGRALIARRLRRFFEITCTPTLDPAGELRIMEELRDLLESGGPVAPEPPGGTASDGGRRDGDRSPIGRAAGTGPRTNGPVSVPSLSALFELGA